MGLVGLLAFTGCNTSKRLRRVDARAQAFLAATEKAHPEANGGTVDIDAYTPYDITSQDGKLHLDLRGALALGARYSREYQTAKETLYQSALALVSAAHDWDWLPANSLNAMLGRDFEVPETPLQGNGTLSLSKRFVSGARLTGSLAFHSLRYLSGDRDVSLTTLANLTLTQPLLAGAGAAVAREPLTQAERNLVYALRSFVRLRKRLLIDIADRYYAALSAYDSLTIARQNYKNLRASRERSEAMAESGRIPLFQVDQARQRELNAESAVILRQEQFQQRKDDLKTLLGLPLDVHVQLDNGDLSRLASASLPKPPLDFDAACRQAIDHRLDFATVRDRLADAQRQTHIAADAVRAKLDLVVSGSATSPTDDHLRSIEFDKGNYQIGLNAELPFDRTDELIALRNAQITENRRRREIEKQHDAIVADLRATWRRLQSAKQNYRIQTVSVNLAKKRVESTELLFQAGRVDIRELLDSQESLILAQNALTLAMVEHRMNWLRLMYQMELLPADPETLWSPAMENGLANQTGAGNGAPPPPAKPARRTP